MIKDLAVKSNITIRQAMKKLSQTGEKCLLIIDGKNTLLGTLSDGDLRRAILKGSNVGNSIKKFYQSKPSVLIESRYKLDDAKKLFTKNKFDLIPIVDELGGLVDILFWETVFKNGKDQKNKKLNVPVVIMAGGKGTRLEPFTKVLPKPLVPIHEKTVIEHILERFTDVGVNEFILTINYKARIMKAYFEELSPDYSVEFVVEKDPLGTAGSLNFLKNRFDKSFFVTNCDIIIKSDYLELYQFHNENNYDMTLVGSVKNFSIPYGTCELDKDGLLKGINEKPEYNFIVNTGLYVLKPDVLKLIPRNKLFHITHLIKAAVNNGLKVGVFPIDDNSWIDVGQWSEYKKVVELL